MKKEYKIYVDEGHSYKEEVLFDTNKNYNNEYANVHFRIDAKHYKYPFTEYEGYDEDVEAYNNEVASIFNSIGWKIKEDKYNIGCETRVNGEENLYIHPQDFSGIVLKNNIKNVYEALENAATFELRHVNIYETHYIMDDAEYKKKLDLVKDNIKEELINMFVTKRKNLYVNEYSIKDIVNKFIINRVGVKEDINHRGFTHEYMVNILNELVELGYILKNIINNTSCYRTINKAEQKKLKVCLY